MTVAIYMITYMDRTIIASAMPLIQKELGFSLITAGWILASFRWGFTLFQIPGAWFGDKIGPRRALTIIVTWWSVFTSLTTLAWSAASMVVVRFIFGVGESGAFPIATRSLSRWMLPAERGFAQGITHAGSRLGAAITPPLVVWMILLYGWRSPFLAFAGLGIVWAALWFFYYRDSPEQHRGVNAAELDLIHSTTGGPRPQVGVRVPWRRILSSRTVWQLALMYFCYQYALAVYLDWFPTYLNSHRGFDLKADGILRQSPVARGHSRRSRRRLAFRSLFATHRNVAYARRIVGIAGFVIAALGILPATLTHDPKLCVAFSCLAFGGLELTVGVSWAIPLDIGGDFAGCTASVMNMCGNIGGAISPALLAYLVRDFGWDVPFFATSALCVIGAIIYAKIDASQRIFAA